jgi:hypothetical protein
MTTTEVQGAEKWRVYEKKGAAGHGSCLACAGHCACYRALHERYMLDIEYSLCRAPQLGRLRVDQDVREQGCESIAFLLSIILLFHLGS